MRTTFDKCLLAGAGTGDGTQLLDPEGLQPPLGICGDHSSRDPGGGDMGTLGG